MKFLLILAIASIATVGHARSDAEPKPLPAAAAPPDVDLRRWDESRFYELLNDQIDVLSLAHGPEQPDTMLDIAELYLSQMMLVEAKDIVTRLEPANAHQTLRQRVLGDMVALLQGQSREDLAASPLVAQTRADRALWLSLNGIATGDADLLRQELKPGLAALAYQPRSMTRVLLPVLSEAIIETRQFALADQALSLLDIFPDISDAPVGYYLRGRNAQLQRNGNTALEAYFEAVKGWDRYAALARLAISDMALEDGGEGALLAAQEVLEYGENAWRGDAIEIRVLEQLATVYKNLNDSANTLNILGKLMLRFPDHPSAENARRDAVTYLDRVYTAGMQGQLPMAAWLDVHLNLVPFFRYYPQFPFHTETLADAVMKLGATDLAADEYERALSLLQGQGAFHRTAPDIADENRLRIKRADALRAGGRLIKASEVLAQVEHPSNADQRRRLNALRADVLADLGDMEGLLRTYVDQPDADNLRDMGQALWRGSSWPESVAFYNRLWTQFPDSFGQDDATYMLIAARRADDDAAVSMLLNKFPELADDQNWLDLARSLTDTPASLTPLRRDSADSRLMSLDTTLKRIGKSGF